MKHTKQQLEKYNQVISSLLKKDLTLDEKHIIFNFLLLVYDLRKAFLADHLLIKDNKTFIEKLAKDLDIFINSGNFFYSIKNQKSKIIQNFLKNDDPPTLGKALGYYCYNHEKWGDHFNSDRYHFRVLGYFNHDPWDIILYNFACSTDEITLTKLKRYGSNLVNKYSKVLNSHFSDLKFTFYFEIELMKSTMYYLNKIKKKDQKFIQNNKEKYDELFKYANKSKIYKMLRQLNDNNKMIVYNFLYYINSDEFLTNLNSYIKKHKVYPKKIKKLEDLFIAGQGSKANDFLFGK